MEQKRTMLASKEKLQRDDSTTRAESQVTIKNLDLETHIYNTKQTQIIH